MENHGSAGSYHSQVVIGLYPYVSWVLAGQLVNNVLDLVGCLLLIISVTKKQDLITYVCEFTSNHSQVVTGLDAVVS